jgi:tetratricopeptide (TPR) repeat protein
MAPSGSTVSRGHSAASDLKSRLEILSAAEQIAYLRSLRSERPGDATLSFHLGNAYLRLDRPDSAIVWYEEAVALDSTYAKAHVNLGIALENAHRLDEAKSHYERALEIDSTDALARCHLGHYFHARGKVGEAVRCYVRALELHPESAQAHYNLGLAFADTRLFAEAIREWERVIALSPETELGRTAAENLRLMRTYVGESPDARGEPDRTGR